MSRCFLANEAYLIEQKILHKFDQLANDYLIKVLIKKSNFNIQLEKLQNVK